ncbi:MAG: hypothetical protein AMXMBFR36_32440 [Acidobacteriota bacterium]
MAPSRPSPSSPAPNTALAAAAPPATSGAGERDDAYAPLEAPDALPVLSLLLFAASLAARPLARLLPRDLVPWPRAVLVPVALALVASTLGALLAALALRNPRRRGIGRLALLLNGIVLILTALAGAAMIWIFNR